MIICPAQMAQLRGQLNPDQSRTTPVYRPGVGAARLRLATCASSSRAAGRRRP